LYYIVIENITYFVILEKKKYGSRDKTPNEAIN
jgi:hypothetical protein